MIMKFFKALFAFIVVLGLGGWLFWPDTWVVRGPMVDFITGKQVGPPDEQTLAERFRLPEGFEIGVFASNVNNARMMRITNEGDLLVSSMRPGEIILLHADQDGDGVADGRTVLMTGLDIPHGLALRDDYLYVAETGRIIRVPFDAKERSVGPIEPVFEGLPPGGNHRTRTIAFGPKGWLYVTIGSTCNACIEDHPYRAAMLRMQPDGSEMTIYATGLRNTVGFDWQPGTGRLYGTDNGRDLLGDDIPHCEINLIEEGQFYGWPFTFDNKAIDPDFGAGKEAEIAQSRSMAHGLGAHVAPLGMRFLTPSLAPPGFEGVALAALHGSWNRSVLSGYKVVALRFDADGNVSQEDFLTGFEKDDDVIGRPVDIEQGPDGALYVSDDYAGVVYRIGWGGLSVSSVQGIVADEKLDPFASLSADELSGLKATGAEIFEVNACAQCHDVAFAAEGVQVKALKNLAVRYDLLSMQLLLNAPPGPMPRPDLTEEEQRALAAYLLATY